MLLENWLHLECSTSVNKEGAQSERAKHVQAKMPKKVKKRRKLPTQHDADMVEGNEDDWEEYYDYLFPDDQAQARNLKILEKAHKWKKDENAPVAPKR